MSKKQHISREDLFQIGLTLKGSIESAWTDGSGVKLVKYKDGWDDKKIAAQHNKPVEAVQKIRRDLFGKIRDRGEAQHDETLLARISELERRIAQLEEVITAPRPSRPLVVQHVSELGRPNGSHP